MQRDYDGAEMPKSVISHKLLRFQTLFSSALLALFLQWGVNQRLSYQLKAFNSKKIIQFSK